MEGGSYDLSNDASAPVSNSVSEALTAPDAPKVLSQRVVGVFQGVRNLTDTMKVYLSSLYLVSFHDVDSQSDFVMAGVQ
jgi:hypothetical protein